MIFVRVWPEPGRPERHAGKKVIDADYHIPVPACVQNAIDDYRSQNDWFGHFLEDKGIIGDEYKGYSQIATQKDFDAF